jgi:hypothetical protein
LQVSVTASKGLLGKCLTKVDQVFSSWGSARAKSYISAKFSITNVRYTFLQFFAHEVKYRMRSA